MKKTHDMENLEEMLRSGKLVAGGFMTNDPRHLDEIIAADGKVVEEAGLTNKQVASRMREITDLAKPRLGQWVRISEKCQASVEDFRGKVVCPWPHAGVFPKRITYLQEIESGHKVCWTDLNIHMIEGHGFYEGKGAFFRVEPEDLIELLF